MKIIDMTCPKCGATMKTDLHKEEARCEYCGYYILIEQEDTLEEIRAKAQSKSYGYHKGRLKAEAEAKERAAKKEKSRRFKIGSIVIGVIILIGVFANLSQTVTKPRVNPFDCIEVSFRGTDGEGEIVVEMTNAVEGIDTNRIDYDISKKYYLSQGQTISIVAESDDYWLTETTKVYTVEGLDEYLKDVDDVSEEALELIHARAEEVLKLNLDKTKNVGYFVDMKPVKLFLATDGKRTNELYDVFEVHFAENGSESTYYVLVCFDNIIVRTDDPSFINMSYGMYWGHLTQVSGAIFIMAYDSLEQVRVDIRTNLESYMELQERDLERAEESADK